MLEFQQFNIVWDKKMAEYEQHAQDLVNEMKVRASRVSQRRPGAPTPHSRRTDTKSPLPRRHATRRSCSSSSRRFWTARSGLSSPASCSTCAAFRRRSHGRRSACGGALLGDGRDGCATGCVHGTAAALAPGDRVRAPAPPLPPPIPPAARYGEAHKMKLKADQLEAWEIEKWKNSKQQEMFAKEARFKKKQKSEMVALRKRVQAGRDEQKKQRQADLERCGAAVRRRAPARASPPAPPPRRQPAPAVPEREGRTGGAAEPGADPGGKAGQEAVAGDAGPRAAMSAPPARCLVQ